MSKKKQPEAAETEQKAAEQAAAQEETAEAAAAQPAEDWKAKFEELNDRYLRMAAEYDNFRKRSDREKKAIYADATADAVSGLLGVADNLERALAQKDCTVEDLRKGIEMVQNEMRSALRKLNVTEMGAVGDAFDPALHNAVAHIEDETLGENVVAQVFQKGYRIGDKVVRHAMVQVAN